MFNQQGEVRIPVRITPVGAAEEHGRDAKGVWRRHIANKWTSNVLVPDSLTDLGGGAMAMTLAFQIEKIAM